VAQFSEYALWKMAIRGITRDDVELVLLDPDEQFPSSTSERHCYVRALGDRRIQVVVEPYDHQHVVTAYEKRPSE
jgi:hypothetical protein